jgi:hypothetical protein
MLVVINLIANIILCLGGAGFYLAIFGRPSSIVYKWPVLRHWALRFGLAAFFAGTLSNVLTVYTPHLSQIILNVGLALVFGWAVLFHYKYFFPPTDR